MSRTLIRIYSTTAFRLFSSLKTTSPFNKTCKALFYPPSKSHNFAVLMASSLASDSKQNGACHPTTAKPTLEIPEAVRGMTELQKDLFRTTITLSALKVEASKISIIQRKVRLEKYLFKNLGRIKSISNAEDAKHKLLLFEPTLVNDESSELKQKVEEMIREYAGENTDLQWETRAFPITFEDWDLRRILRAVLSKDLDFSSYSQAGHIVHVNLRENLLPYKKVIGQILLEKVGKCRTVVNKIDGISSEYRNFELDLLAGEHNYVTELIEDGVRYKLDFSKVFWNSRLSHEHERVVKMFDSRSLVYDACAGVGPFVLPAIKKGRIRHAFANDLNPESVKWMKENMALNKIPSEKLSIYNLDAAEFIRGPVAEDLNNKITNADAEEAQPSGAFVMMNLPAYAVNFLPSFRGMLADLACCKTPPEFPIRAFCYLFAKAHEDVPDKWYEHQAQKMVRDFVKEKEAAIDLIHHVRTVSSRKEMFCVQLTLSWDFLTHKEGGEKRSLDDNGEEVNDSKKINKTGILWVFSMLSSLHCLRRAALRNKEWISFAGYPTTVSQTRSSRMMPAFKIHSLRRRIAEFLSNKFDEKRVNEVGPDLACLEWLMECGSTEVLMSDEERITSIRQMKKYIKKKLEEKGTTVPVSTIGHELEYELKWKHVPHVHIVKVDASDSAIADEGFKYFHDLKRLEALKLNFCDYFGDEAIRELALGRPAATLRDIEIVLNPSISDGAVYWLSRLKALHRAHFYFLPYVSNRHSFIRQLKLAVPRCKVTFPEAVHVGYGYEDETKPKKS